MRPVALLVFALLAGCAAPLAEPPPARVPFTPPIAVSMDWPGAEPVVAVMEDGTIFTEGIGRSGNQNVNKVWRSDDGGATWVDVTPQGPGQDRSNDGFVAVGNDGKVYAANVYQLTLQMFRSDDKGRTWTLLPAPRTPALMHRHWIVPTGARTVHLAIEGLPPSFLPAFGGQSPGTVTGTANDGMWYARSDDLGATWSTPVHIDPKVNFAGQGPMVVDPEGQRIFIPRYEDAAGELSPKYESGHWYLLASEDGGRSWARREMFDLTSELATAVPGLAMDEAGTLYFVWSQESEGSSRLRYSFSKDAGVTWATPRAIGPGNGTHALAWVAARGPPGEIGLMWYAADVEGRAVAVNASWHVDYAAVTGADSDAPEWTVTRVTQAPVHEGNVCAKGPACAAGEDRRLLDYPWMVYREDEPYLVWASTAWEKPSAFMMFAKGGVRGALPPE